jgi:hypothetical protein
MSDMPDRPARPWDLYNKNIGRVELEISVKRLDICKACDKFIKATTQCRECWCVMAQKTKLPNAECPKGKWGKTYNMHTENMEDGLPTTN